MKNVILIFIVILLLSFSSSNCTPEQIDINSASLEELQTLKGIGQSTAEKIIATRPFGSIQDLTKVSGIGNKSLQNLLNNNPGKICVLEDSSLENTSETNPKEEEQTKETTTQESPQALEKININTATEQELTILTGIGPATAKLIIESRPYCSIEELEKVKGIGESTINKLKTQNLAYVEECEKQLVQEQTQEAKNPEIKQETIQLKKQETENVIKLNNQEKSITGKVVYQSKTEKIRKYAIPAFFVLLAGIIFPIIKN